MNTWGRVERVGPDPSVAPGPSPYEGETVKVVWVYLGGGATIYHEFSRGMQIVERYGWRINVDVNWCSYDGPRPQDLNIEEAEAIRDELTAAIVALRAVEG